jgi:hypothetical protein
MMDEAMPDQTEDIVSEYLAMMDLQRERLFKDLGGLDQDMLWQHPAEDEWSIGENLDHLRVINSSSLKIFKITWVLLFSWTKLRYDKPYQTEIDNVYKRPGFPLNTGWIWSSKYTPSKPTSLAVLEENLSDIHQEMRKFIAFLLLFYCSAQGWLYWSGGLLIQRILLSFSKHGSGRFLA